MTQSVHVTHEVRSSVVAQSRERPATTYHAAYVIEHAENEMECGLHSYIGYNE